MGTGSCEDTENRTTPGKWAATKTAEMGSAVKMGRIEAAIIGLPHKSGTSKRTGERLPQLDGPQ